MCGICGCGDTAATKITNLQNGQEKLMHAPAHAHDHEQEHGHPRQRDREHAHPHDRDHSGAASVMILNKVDLLPRLEFDLDEAVDNVRQVNPNAKILQVSARDGEGLTLCYDWLRQAVAQARTSPAFQEETATEA